MKLVADENIIFANEAFSPFGEVSLISGRKINNEILKDADVLIVRSITNVDEKLLNGTRVKFVGTATIGTDHVEIDFLKRNNISFSDAEGCNSDSVAEYFLSALLKITVDNKITLGGKSIGIIGVGNVGSKVAGISKAIGLKVLKNDPPRERAGDGNDYVSLDNALSADIISLHVPLSLSGIDKTYHLLNLERISLLKPGTILINTSRGPVIDNTALLNQLEEKNLKVCLDVWEGEPIINTTLLEKVDLASAHVAGYSFEGKVNGTRLIFDALCKFLNKNYDWIPQFPPVQNNKIELTRDVGAENILQSVVEQVYNISADDSSTKEMTRMDEAERAVNFDKLRKEYPLRREFNNYTVVLRGDDRKLGKVLKALRFNIQLED